jgi:hypothetical protein
MTRTPILAAPATVFKAVERGKHRQIREWTQLTLEEIATGARDRPAVRHPLGFICFPLIRAGDHGLCVHYWPAVATPPNPQAPTVHSHSWHLSSHLLAGRIANHRSVVTEAGESPLELYAVTSGPDGDVITPTGRRVRSADLAAETYQRGQTYHLAAGQFHWTNRLTGSPTITVVAGRGTSTQQNFFVAPAKQARQRSKRRQYGPAASRSLAVELGLLLPDSSPDS